MKNECINEDTIQVAIDSLKNGNYNSFDLVYKTYYNSILAFLLKKTCNKSVAEDLTSETFIKFLVSLNRYEHISKARLGSYLYSIAFRNFVDFFRANRRAEMLDIDGIFSDRFLIDPVLENQIDRKIRKSLLFNAIDLLGEDYKKVIEMYYFQELSYNEIQTKLMIPEGTLKVRLNRARKLLNIKLSKKQVFSQV